MKIVQINTTKNIGGAAKVMSQLSNQFNLSSNSSKIVAWQTNDKENQITVPNSIIFKILSLLELSEFFYKKRTVTNISAFMQSEIVNIHNLHGGFFNIHDLIKISDIKPTVITLHDLWFLNGNYPYLPNTELNKFQKTKLKLFENLLYPIFRKLIEPILKKIKSDIYNSINFNVIAPSKWIANKAQDGLFKGKKIKVIVNGVDEKIFKPIDKASLKTKLNLPEDKFIISFVAHSGANNTRKGYVYFQKLIKFLNHKDFHFLVIGGTKTSDEKNITYTNFISSDNELNLYYNAADILVHTSIIDNCSMVVLEALSSGTPVISFNNGGTSEIITDGVNGILVDNKDVKNLAKKIILLKNDSNKLKKMSDQARSIVCEKFTLKKQAEEYLRFYQETIDQQK